MPVFAVNMKHTPESCPIFNKNVGRKFDGMVSRREEAAKKHGVKVMSAYTSTLNHPIFYIVEASSQQAVENYFIEIGFAFWNTVEIITQVQPVEDVIENLGVVT